MARQSWFQKIGNAIKKMASGRPLGRQTSVPTTPRAQKAAARGHRAGEYHFGRVSAVKDENDKVIAHRVGPVPDPSGETYRGARGATLDHVLKMLRREKSETVTLCIYGRLYPGDKKFKWFCNVFDLEQLISDLEEQQKAGSSAELTAFNVMGLLQMPDRIVAWEVRPHA